MATKERKPLFILPRGLQSRLTLISMQFALVPLAIVSILVFTQAQIRLQDEIGAHVQEIAAATGDGVEQFLSTRLAEIKVLANASVLISPDSTPEEKVTFLRSVQDAYGYYKSIDITDVTGHVIAASDQTSGDQSHRDWFQQGVKGETFVTDVYYLTSVQSYVITLSAPIFSSQHQFIGVAAGHIAGPSLFDVVASRHIGASGKVFVVDKAGRNIADQDNNALFTDWSASAPIKNGLAGERGTAIAANVLSGEQTLFGYLPIKGTDNWIVVGALPLSEVFAPINSLAANTLLVAGVAALIVALVAFFVTRGIAEPIRKLAQAATIIGQGKWNVEVPAVKTHDEIGQLADAFSTMSKELKANYGALEDHVEKLETARVEREKLIKDLQAAKRLAEENSRLKSEFLSTMSHELRTPLNAIEGFTGIILNKIGGTDYNTKTNGYLNRIRANSKRLLQLINDFLDLSRVEAGRLELANQPFSPERLARRWQDEIGVLAEKKGLQFDIRVDNSLPPTLYGDEEAISKVALNLLGNAIKFTEQGQVALKMEHIGGTWGIVVEDTGIGIPLHAREFIFDEFRQVDQTSKRKYGGTGLGLAIVQKYTRAMGGTVQVKSEFGKGSTFTVSLPLKTTA